MKRFIVAFAILMVFGFASVASADMEAVNVSFGSLTLSGNLQAGFSYYIGDELLGGESGWQAVDRQDNYEFYLKRFRFITKGWVLSEKISHFTQTEFVGSAPKLLDLKMGFHYIPYTAIYFGKYIPKFSFFLPASTTNLYLIDYPLYAGGLFGGDAQAWRHTGLSFDVCTKWVDAELGIWNGFTGVMGEDGTGYTYAGANFSDDTNTGKDINLMIAGKPLDGLRIQFNFWYGQPLAGNEVDDGELTEINNTLMMYGGGVFYKADFGLVATAEVFMSTLNWAEIEDVREDLDPDSISTMTYNIMAGFNLNHFTGVPLEILLRYDFWDPNTENDEDENFGYKDELTYITFGLNYYLLQNHAKFSLNYIYKGEAWEDVLNKAGDDTQDGISNDELKIQVQVAF